MEHFGRGTVGLQHGPTAVGRTGTGAGQAHPHSARGPGVAIGHGCGGPLVAGHDELHLGGIIQRIVDGERVDADYAEDGVHAAGPQGLNDCLAAGYPSNASSPRHAG